MDNRLYTAVQNNDYNLVVKLLNQGADPKRNDSIVVLPAIMNDNLDMLKLLVNKGANLHRDNDSMLASAVDSGYTEMVKYFLDNGFNVNSNGGYLTIAIDNNDINMLNYLIAKGAKNLDEALLSATKMKKQQMIDILIRNGASLNNQAIQENIRYQKELDDYLFNVMREGDVKTVQEAISHGADITNLDERDVLRAAVESGNVELVSFLYEEYGLGISFPNIFSELRNISTSRLINDYLDGIIRSQEQNIGNMNKSLEELSQELKLAESRGNKFTINQLRLKILDKLAEKGADQINNSFLQYVQNNNLEMVRTLVEGRGANIHYNDDEALSFAALEGSYKIVEYLIQQGANVRANDNDALINAADSGEYEIVELLIKAGADAHARYDYVLFDAVTLSGTPQTVSMLLGLVPDYSPQVIERAIKASEQQQSDNWRPIKNLLNKYLKGHQKIFPLKETDYEKIMDNLGDKELQIYIYDQVKQDNLGALLVLEKNDYIFDIVDAIELLNIAKHGGKVMKHLIDKNGIYYEQYMDAVYEAIIEKDKENLQWLLSTGIFIDFKPFVYKNIEEGDIDQLKFLLKFNDFWDDIDEYELLQIAVTNKNEKMVNFLLNNPDFKKIFQKMVNDIIEQGETDRLKFLTNVGLEYELTKKVWLNAIANGHIDIVKYIHENDIDVNIIFMYIEDVYKAVISTGNINVIKLFIDANSNQEDIQYLLKLAEEKGYNDIIQYLKSLSNSSFEEAYNNQSLINQRLSSRGINRINNILHQIIPKSGENYVKDLEEAYSQSRGNIITVNTLPTQLPELEFEKEQIETVPWLEEQPTAFVTGYGGSRLDELRAPTQTLPRTSGRVNVTFSNQQSPNPSYLREQYTTNQPVLIEGPTITQNPVPIIEEQPQQFRYVRQMARN